MTKFRVAPLGRHERADFSSGSADLDRYFWERVTQDVRRRVATCFVAVDEEEAVAGFYTLSASSLSLDSLGPEMIKRLPRYALIPAVLLGRLAVATKHQGRKLGAALVADAEHRATRAEIGAYAMMVDPKDETAARFYERLGYRGLASTTQLIKPLKNI